MRKKGHMNEVTAIGNGNPGRHGMRALLPVLLLVAATAAHADESKEKPADLPIRIERHAVSYVVNPDASFVEERAAAYTLLKESAVESAKQFSIGYSTSIQTAEMLEAYTRKPDGRRIEVPKDSYQITTNSGRGADAPVFSDRTTMRWVFPDVATGDTLVYSYRLVAKEPMFEGHFSTSEQLSRWAAYDVATVRIDAPLSLPARWHANELEKVREEERDGRRILEWSYKNPNPKRSERKDWSVHEPDREPGVAFSTFPDYEAIAKAYGVVALPKAMPTDRIRKLADEIAGKETDERTVARALYEWVSRNVHYAGNCIGLGAVVPRDLDFVLDNRIGDCKDHATLLEALLAAKDIDSTQVLINSGNVFALPKIPVVSMVNHVLNYIPSLDLYVDSTSSYTPFGMLPDNDRGKPVLHVEDYRDGTRTPVPAIGSHRQRVTSDVTIKRDGSVVADVEVELEGDYAVAARSMFRDIPDDRKADLVKDYAASQGKVGRGTFEMDDPKPLTDRFRYSAHVEIDEQVPTGAGALTIDPMMFTPHSVAAFAVGAMAEVEKHDVQCMSGYATEQIVYRFPDDMEILSAPDPLKVSNDLFSYEATYARTDDTLTVKRTFDDRTPGRVCSPQLIQQFKDALKPVLANVRTQVLYKLPAPEAADTD